MKASADLLRNLKRRVRDSGPGRALRARLYERRFAGTDTWRNLARGKYRSFDEARRSAPSTMPTGYLLDDDAYERRATLELHDYPPLFWMRERLERGCTLVDLGGHVGLQYYLFGELVRYAERTRWIVAEQPHVVERGRVLAAARKATQLSFVEDHRGIACDVFFSSGCVQSIETPVAQLIEGLGSRPEVVVLNKLPILSGETVVTLQNTGRSFTPCTLYDGATLIRSIEALGYRLRDRWRCVDRSIHVPFHPELTIEAFSGLYFESR